MTNSVDIRQDIVTKFRRDLAGPYPIPDDAPYAQERLKEAPSHWYLTGWIAPAPESPMAAEDDDDPAFQEDLSQIEEAENTAIAGGGEDEGESGRDTVAPRRILPTSLGLTTALPEHAKTVEVLVEWGDYVAHPAPPDAILDGEEEPSTRRPKLEWERMPRESRLSIDVQNGSRTLALPDSVATGRKGGALEIYVVAKPTHLPRPGGEMPGWSLSVFVVNRRAAVHTRAYADLSYAFQVRMTLSCEDGFADSTDVTGYGSDEHDLRVYDLHYADIANYAAGRNTSAAFEPDEDGVVRRIWTEPLPTAEVERVAPEKIDGVAFEMSALAKAAAEGAETIRTALGDFPERYTAWIEGQRGLLPGFTSLPERERTARELIDGQERARDRIAEGIEQLATNNRARQAFLAMNEAIERAARQRFAQEQGKNPEDVDPPTWRPFQLAFILLNLNGLGDRLHADRELVDLLFFPTGGGKTEAYLGLAAYAIAARRLGAGGVLGAGVSIVMRYTLRLLTLDQLSRAAGVICALELMREESGWKDEKGRRLLGDWPIEIGLWIGSKASPNRLGGKGNTGDDTAVTRVRHFKGGRDAPAPIRACPWCGHPFGRDTFHMHPNSTAPTRMLLVCQNIDCAFTGDRPLPVLTVDDEIYRRLPAFLIATIDKFAGLPWEGRTGAYFGHVDRFETDVGFYGAAEPGVGHRFQDGYTLDPPELIVQDELHLISGPLGTVAGLYEAAIDGLCSRVVNGKRVRPKIVASTATVRRADNQITALFDRAETAMFPPPGIRRQDSFFAATRPASEEPARLYLGLAALGRGPKLVFLRALTTIAAAANAAFEDNAGTTPNPADPYMTALCYFNALRELGGARRIVEDEVADRLRRYGHERYRLAPAGQPFRDRQIGWPLELTSRISTDEVAEAKRRLETPAGEKAAADVAMATNMISVGLDISRLGLMLVQGQPKTAAEYIQATSRVGRDSNRPGLVIAVLNVHKPRDRAHYERFRYFHETFYRAVEATSVTPWADGAIDRALAALVVGLVRHLDPSLTPEEGVEQLAGNSAVRQQAIDLIVGRASHLLSASAITTLKSNIEQLLDNWVDTADAVTAGGSRFGYKKRGALGLLNGPLDTELSGLDPKHQVFVANRSMRDVEPTVSLRVVNPYGGALQTKRNSP
ncbi:DISARM system helicase DrmA [Minwuia thermotolerans]|uniref:DISARM system helicase DrmA n=1 Tax=Minwuia thermotolerans TaxID=2056226 RepID=UPI000D6DC423|nr:DISARM system helicase DrmA [Minwuia thermotolerans]